jgi:hypothetical protein
VSEAAALTTGREQTEGAADLDQQLGRHVAAAQQRMARAVLVGKLQNDPLADVVDAMAQALGVQHEIHRAGVRQQLQASATLEQQLHAAVEEARQPIDPASIDRLEKAAVTGADRRAAELARSRNWRTLLIAVTVLVGTGFATGLGGYWVGRHSQVATGTALTEAAFRSGPAAADLWLRLMQANDGNAVMKTCAETTTRPDGTHRACGLGLWLDPAPRPLPQTMPRP